ncbi:MAG: hypothetical protein AVDCRST_MAG28-2873, partial [uncultured Rubrobacteraceae bacterium]
DLGAREDALASSRGAAGAPGFWSRSTLCGFGCYWWRHRHLRWPYAGPVRDRRGGATARVRGLRSLRRGLCSDPGGRSAVCLVVVGLWPDAVGHAVLWWHGTVLRDARRRGHRPGTARNICLDPDPDHGSPGRARYTGSSIGGPGDYHPRASEQPARAGFPDLVRGSRGNRSGLRPPRRLRPVHGLLRHLVRRLRGAYTHRDRGHRRRDRGYCRSGRLGRAFI